MYDSRRGRVASRRGVERISSEHIRIVEDFIDAWSAIDLDAIMGFLCNDCVHHDIPMDAVEGKTAIRIFVEGFVGRAREIVRVIHHVAESAAGIVMTGRNDRFEVGEAWGSLPVMGIFALRDGRIRAWREDFDLEQYRSQMPG